MKRGVYIQRLQELPVGYLKAIVFDDPLGYLEAWVEEDLALGGRINLPSLHSILLGGFMTCEKGYLTLITKISTLLGSLPLKYTQR